MSANPAPTGRAEAERQSLIAFYLTGRRPDAGLDAVDGADARPALLARYRDLTALRYDFPLVLARDSAGKNYVQCLSALVDGVVREIAKDDDGDRLTRHLLRLEREIRALLATGAGGSLPELWDAAAGRLSAQADGLLKDSLARARAALKTDGEVVDCDRAMPARLIAHAWRLAQEMRARETGDSIARLAQKLSDIIGADLARAAAGRSAENLRAAVGTAHAEVFDFEAMSRVLAKGASRASLPKRRRERIQGALAVLRSQRFFPVPGEAGRAQMYSFEFDNCAGALAAYRERRPAAIELARAIAIARLEAEGEYNEAKHDALFARFGEGGLGQEELARFPDYFIHVRADRLQAAESERLAEMLSAGLPVKILLQTDDLMGESPATGDARLAPAMRARQLAGAAIAMTDVYVLQSSGSNLFQFRDRILRGMTYSGPALFSVYSGAAGNGGTLPPYLAAAAAMESRAFPAYCYDPSAGPNWASRFDLAANSQAERDWPVQRFAYEGDGGQRITEEVAFTFIDFLACDPRHAGHFARVPRAKWSAGMVPAGDYLAAEAGSLPDKVPCVLIVDGNGRLHKAIVDDKAVRAAQRCRESWHSLQELAGIHNSHAERLLASERRLWEEREAKAKAAAAAPESQAPSPVPAAAPATAAAAAAASVPAEEKINPDEARIETARCTTCNECTQINDRMFAYNENKQAYIANPDAGTYRQMVEAAESCQVSIIHPGKPRNPNEPGLDELVKRAEPFL